MIRICFEYIAFVFIHDYVQHAVKYFIMLLIA